MLIIANDFLKGITFPNTEWMYLKENMGLTDVKKKVEEGEFTNIKPKVLVFITGCEEAVERHPALLNVVRNSLTTIRKALPNTIILLCAPDPVSQRRTLCTCRD